MPLTMMRNQKTTKLTQKVSKKEIRSLMRSNWKKIRLVLSISFHSTNMYFGKQPKPTTG
jgi:hypothetical protein